MDLAWFNQVQSLQDERLYIVKVLRQFFYMVSERKLCESADRELLGASADCTVHAVIHKFCTLFEQSSELAPGTGSMLLA